MGKPNSPHDHDHVRHWSRWFGDRWWCAPILASQNLSTYFEIDQWIYCSNDVDQWENAHDRSGKLNPGLVANHA